MGESEKNVDEVCAFLFTRFLPEEVLENFRKQKVDSKVVRLLTDEQLMDLGLKAVGDIITLREMCKEPAPAVSDQEIHVNSTNSVRRERRSQLLALLNKHKLGDKTSEGQQGTSGRRAGRPKNMSRSISFGLRMSDGNLDNDGDRIAVLVKSPLGDKNNISLSVDVGDGYGTLLHKVQEAFFPDGCNPVVGEAADYILEIVNSRNQNVRSSMKGTFSMGHYIEQKKIPGTPKCYLLCLTDSSTNKSDEELEENLSYENNPINDTEDNISEMPGTPSMEVVFRLPQDDGNNGKHEDIEEPAWETVADCVQGTIAAKRNCTDPVEVLGFFQKVVLQGRSLETESQNETTEGDTLPIYVSRFNLWETGILEIIGLKDQNVRLPLDVTFYGELAQDLGGPRREFLALLMKEALMEERGIFIKTIDGYRIKETSSNLQKNHYFGVGLLAGISFLQQGPLLSFLNEDQVQNLLADNMDSNLSESERQFREGLNCLGLVDLVRGIPCLIYLFRSSAQKEMTLRKLVHLLQPEFSEAGSTKRQMEESIYKHFVAHLREVSSGRRGAITLGTVLRFVTGAELEPPLGFQNHPNIVFADLQAWIPRAQTCICQLTLPIGINIPSKSKLFEAFDMAFANTYFGVM